MTSSCVLFLLTAATAVGIWEKKLEITVRVTESLRKSKLGLWVLSFSSSLSASKRWEEEVEETAKGGRGFDRVLVRGIGLGYGDKEEYEPRRQW
ncbi:ATP-dependent zinc metalloprotease FtsH [Pyrus ussuriensis x Pyrus communis]|uniref:ATP-dependent zinc metalloprotease FtsH n=1 Tax=Pyrus ussuriensis x Pyrus communis TaxID=2448454 RepID=A0A5N5H433_9ROSA|nr:ATP-dependent zinc metalloprotease FtsH [Pyrus ussuriensis x Pyrus communis]